MKKTIKNLLLSLSALFVAASMFAQGTTSTLTGRITDNAGLSLPGATVIAVHVPSGSQYYSVTNAEGYYTIPAMRPGGPYEVTVSMMGCQSVKFKDVVLPLGETLQTDAQLKDDAQLLDEVLVVASSSKFASEKTGAATNVSNQEMMSMPNVDRSISGIAKLSPYSNGMSFGGFDGRSTNFTVDGANLNNNFGLSSTLPGGGTPISLDALEEIQLVVAPFDVRQSNFVGGGINAITKSGTNTFKGTAYTYYSDEGLRGNLINHENLGPRKFEQNRIYGVTVGGPIIKNKLFFFVNFEAQKKPEQTIKYQAPADKQVVLQKISDKLMKDYGYDAGSYTDFPGGTENMKILARVDWNISDNHKFSLRFNKTDNKLWQEPNPNSCDDNKAFRNWNYSRASEQSQPFSNNMYSLSNNVMSFAGELNSRFGDKVANRLHVAYTNINDQRGSNSALFPQIDIMDNADYSSGNFKPYTALGYELFSFNNGVKNNNLIATDDVTIYAGAHTITAGLRFEMMDALNSYMRNGTGYYRYASAEDFLEGKLPLSFCLTYGYDGNDKPAGRVQYNQYAIYAQDDWKITPKFKLTYGIRADLIAFDNSAIVTNPNIAAIDYGGRHIDTGVWPKTRPQISPRVGFNWDAFGDKSLVLRGGLGLFQGRLPLVFFTNMPQYSGMIQGSYNIAADFTKDGDGKINGYDWAPGVKTQLEKLTAGGKFMTDVKEIIKTLGLPTSPSSESAGLGGNAYISGVDQNFRMPQMMKVSLAADYIVPVNFPFNITVEGIFNKTIWGVTMEDWSLNNTGAELKYFDGPDKRVMNINASRYNSTSAYVLTNTNKGYGYSANVTINMEPAKNLKLMMAYTRTESKEITGLPGSSAESAFTGQATVNGVNLSGVQRSQYVMPDKLMANIGYTLPKQGLHFNLFYQGYSSFGTSFTYSNDMNGDGNPADLIYIPAQKNEILFTSEADADAFWTFVNNDSYLRSHKGQYAEANGSRAPWVHRFDFSISKDFKFNIGKTSHNIQISASIDNVGNLINSSWGVRKWSVYQTNLTKITTISPLKYEGVKAGTNIPMFSMNKVNGVYPTHNYTKPNNLIDECWHALIGIKYFFN